MECLWWNVDEHRYPSLFIFPLNSCLNGEKSEEDIRLVAFIVNAVHTIISNTKFGEPFIWGAAVLKCCSHTAHILEHSDLEVDLSAAEVNDLASNQICGHVAAADKISPICLT